MSVMTTILQMTRALFERPHVASAPNIRLRPFAGPADIDAWLELRSRAFARQKISVRQWTHDDFEREFLQKPWWKPEAMWLAVGSEEPDRIVGSVTLAWRQLPPEGKPVVHWLMVTPSHQRRGIGRLLMAALETAVWDAGHRQVWLETHSAWREGTALYRSLGYSDIT
jgi:GNAT superfamily N-acetyltransferase